MDQIHQSAVCNELSENSLSEARKTDESPSLQDKINGHGRDYKLETDSEPPTDLCDGFCQECDWVNLDNFDSVNEKLKELEPILYDNFRVQSNCCKKLLKKKEMLLILVLEVQEIRRRITFDRMMIDVVKEEKARLRREYKQLKNQEMKEKERNLEMYDCNLFKEYQALMSASAAEHFLGTIIEKRKTLEHLEVLIQHKMSTFKKDEVKNLKRKKGTKLPCKKSKSRSPNKSAINQRNTETNALNAENITFNNAAGQQNRFSDTEERLERLRNRMRDVLAQHAIEMDLEPFLETHL